MEQELEKQYQLIVKQQFIEGKEKLYHELEKRREIYQRRARQDAELVYRGMKTEEIAVVTTATLPGHKVQNILGAVTGSHMLKYVCTMPILSLSLTLLRNRWPAEDAPLDEVNMAIMHGRDEAYADLLVEAHKLNANAIVSLYWHSRLVREEVVEMSVSGTAWRVEHEASKESCCAECGTKKGGKGKGGGDNQQKGGKGKGKGKDDDDDEEESDKSDDEQKKEGGGKGKGKGKGGKGGGGCKGGGPELTNAGALDTSGPKNELTIPSIDSATHQATRGC